LNKDRIFRLTWRS